MVLRRVVGTTNSQNIDVTVRALVRNFRLKEDQLIENIKQAVLIIIISPTQISAAQWPGGGLPGQRVDPSMLRRDDILVIKGRPHDIQACEAIAVNGVNVRYEMQVIG